jgi:2-desacetyl-2-hydroxyethyl bacteriochlorophyllide A dehydrogenase
MKAVRLTETGKPLAIQEIPTPQPGEGEVLVRVRAAGICHSDAHYRAGRSPTGPLPLTLGHEVAGEILQAGPGVEDFQPGDRVCLHYLVTCGKCAYCLAGTEQFCPYGAMLGKHRDGGYAEAICLPSRGVFHLPGAIPNEHGAILMCSSATAFHALKKARLQPGESVAVYGLGGLGISALQLAFACGASQVFAVDLQPVKLALAEKFGAVPVDASRTDPVREIRSLTGGRGVDVALELVGLPLTMQQCVRSLAPMGRAAVAGITEHSFEVHPYTEIINREAELIGVSDHLAAEIPQLLAWALDGRLDLAEAVTRTVPLEAEPVNEVLDQLEAFGEAVRVVIQP